MGKIRKIATQKHEATLSPFVSEQVDAITKAPVAELPSLLARFPRPWPFPRGDLYHWIPVLNRFDDLLLGFNKAYGLEDGPQCIDFSQKYMVQEGASSQDLAADADRILIESILDYTLLLYENCANRSLYASSAHLDCLLNTTCLSVLNLVLRLALRLGQRYAQERVRMGGGPYLGPIMPNVLAQHYQFDLQKLDKLALPFVKSLHPAESQGAVITYTEKGTTVTPAFAADLATLVQDTESGKWLEYGSAWINYTRNGDAPSADSLPASPTPGSRHANGASSSRLTLRVLEVSAEELSERGLPAILTERLPDLPQNAHFDFLCRLRNAAALSDSVESRRDAVAARIMAVANLAFVYPEMTLQSKVFHHEADETRRSQLPYQLCDLLHPPGKSTVQIPLNIQSAAMRALESLSHHRNKSNEVLSAIGFNVNHGVLTYLVRKASNDLDRNPDQPETPEEAAWFSAFFDLLHSLGKSIHRAGDAFSAAGLLEAFVQALKSKSVKADQNRHRVLTFLDVFVYNTRDAFAALVNAGGLDAISELVEREVDSALQTTKDGKGLPANWKTPMTFSKISYVQQQNLRTLFKVLKNMMSINGGPFDRLLRNLIESTQLLGGLRTVIEHPSVYGSNVWSGAVEIFTNFIHSEPTSYAAIAEAGLTKAFLDTVILPLDNETGKYGMLPTSEALVTVPLAFGAICLNENGMKAFTDSKALDQFFDIQLRMACIKSATTNAQEQEQLGSAFDELARHHPSLKPQIMRKLVDLTVGLRTYVMHDKYQGSLSIIDASGETVPEYPSQSTEDVEMSDVDSPPEKPMIAKGSTVVKASTVDTVHTIFGMLHGVFHNHALCTPYAELGGLQALIDIAATPVIHPEQILQFAQGPVLKTIQVFVHTKPHLMIPLLLQRLRLSVNNISWFAQKDAADTTFASYVKGQDLSSLPHAEKGYRGTDVVAELVVIRNLTHILTKSFSDIPHRNSHPVSSVNMTDMYIEIVTILGQLQSRCICEYMLLQDMAPAQDAGSKIAGSALDAAQEYRAAYMAKSDQAQQTGVAPEEPINPAAQPAAKDDNGETTEQSRAVAKQNFKIICSMLSRLPTDIAWLYSAIGKSILLSRRITSDPYNKQCAFSVAKNIAESIVSVLDYKLPDGMIPKLVDYYHRSAITCTTIAMVEKSREAGMQPLTLILWKFKQAGGYETLTKIGRVLLEHAQLPGYGESAEAKSRGPTWAVESLRNLTVFLGRSTSNKEINEAQQTLTLTQASRDGNKASPDNFSAGQFLVELRTVVLKFIIPIWSSESIINMHPEFVKAVSSILQLIFNADMESGAFSRKDKVPAHAKQTHRHLNRGPSDVLDTLSRDNPRDLVNEAMFRCNNSRTFAAEYCDIRRRYPGTPRFPIPERDLAPEPAPRPWEQPSAALERANQLDLQSETENIISDEEVAEVVQRIVDSTVPEPESSSPSAPPLAEPSLSEPAAETDTKNDTKDDTKDVAETSIVTIEELDELRSELRLTMVDRCLTILNKFDKLSFSIADLIIAGTVKASDPASMRADISETLIQSLISYQGSGDVYQDFAKVASGAHLLGVILQDKNWFEAAREYLRENFDALGMFLADVPSDSSTNISWLAYILLVLEKVLAEETQPHQIQWVPPNPDEPLADQQNDKVADSKAPLIALDEKKELFGRLLKLMPRVAKDQVLGTAIVRVLVCLTRNREIAVDLSDRKNLQRLFVMAKQLSTVTDKKFHGSILVVLRQIIEDEATIRQIMQSEIRVFFDKQSHRAIDTTMYTRQLYYLVLRSPEIFVDVTNELVMLTRFDRSQAPQNIVLKSSQTTPKTGLDRVLGSNADAPPANEEAGPSEDSTSKGKEPEQDAKPSVDIKAPLVERVENVTNFLLSELLAYRDVQDTDATKPEKKDQASEDVVMGEAEASGSEVAQTSGAEPKTAKPTEPKTGFQAEEHPIFIYRCFLLQSLTELLQSYNCCKLHFINYSRKAEPQANTPSKPRSGVLYYLLTALIPTGVLLHATGEKAKMTGLVSNWAISVIVALCAKTPEQRDSKRREDSTSEEEPVLAHVRKFVLEHALKAFKETTTAEAPEAGYARLLCIADLFNKLLAAKPGNGSTRFNRTQEGSEGNPVPTQKQIARIMFEKSYIPALTAALTDIDTEFPGGTRVVKHILRPLKLLTHTAIELSMSGEASSEPDQSADEDEVSSASSVSGRANGREETPDLFRNSTLGMFEPGREDMPSSESSEDEEVYADDMDYDEEQYDDEIEDPNDGAVSDDDEDMEGMGPIEGISGDVPMDVEIELEHHHDDDDDSIDDEDVESDSDDEDDVDGDADVEIVEEISGDDENVSFEDDEEAGEWQDEDEENANFEGQPHQGLTDPSQADPLAEEEEEDHLPILNDVLARVAEDGSDFHGHGEILHPDDVIMDNDDDPDEEYGHYVTEDMGAPQDLDEDEEPSEEDDEDDGEDDEDMDDEDVVYNLDEFDEEDGDMPPFGFDWPPSGGRRAPHLHRHVHHMPLYTPHDRDRPISESTHGLHYPSVAPLQLVASPPAEPDIDSDSVPGFRGHRMAGPPRPSDDDANPLLSRSRRPNDAGVGGNTHARHRNTQIDFSGPGPALIARLERELMESGGMGLESALMNLVQGAGNALQFTMRPVPGQVPEEMRYVLESHAHNSRHHSHHSPARDDPGSVVTFDALSTENRWQEAARLLFGPSYTERSQKIINTLLKCLVPPAIERDRERKIKEAAEAKKLEEQRAKEKAIREEREAREKKEEEERQAKEAEERAKAEAEAEEAAARERAEREALGEEEEAPEDEGEAMDVSEDNAAESSEQPAESQEPRPRVVTQVRGRELDITDLGIDIEYLDALPEEMREEVIMAQYAERRSTAVAAGEEPTAISQEFLDALPPEIRAELLQQEARDRRRREREEQRRRQPAADTGPPDPASFIASLDPALRQEVLAESGDDILEALPAELAAEARALGGHRHRPRLPASYLGSNENSSYLFGGSGSRGRIQGERDEQQQGKAGEKAQRRPIVQMVDRSGVATLLRLMFAPMIGASRHSLNAVLMNACGNRQTRAEVVNGLLGILQDGCIDAASVSRCYAQLTTRAKQSTAAKTPQSNKKQPVQLVPSTEISPNLVINQCLSTLHYLAEDIPTIPQFFLTEHEISGSFKTKLSKKGKGKENRASKYPFVALLGLLERDSILGYSPNMEQLSALLAMVTRPLGDLLKKSEQKSTEDKTGEDAAAAAPSSTVDADGPAGSSDLPTVHSTANGSASSVEPIAAPSASAPSASAPPNESDSKKRRTLTPPDIAPETLKPIVNILLTRECSGQTFRHTLTTGSNLAAVPGAKDVFRDELVKNARELSGTIQQSLRSLVEQLRGVETDMEAQSLAMVDFSPNGSDQTKLSRIITALDYFYDPDGKTHGGKETKAELAEKNQELLQLFEDKTFIELWVLLSDALEATKRSGTDYFFNVATILLPLIEALLVICKRVPLKKKKPTAVEGPGAEMLGIFFSFTNRHKKILNDLVRQNPKLMNANFSVLVKNSSVLEFDNKRNYFSRRLHHRTGDMRQYPHPTLQLNVRRNDVFLDSYKAIFFKSADEIKYGKLNVRFQGEEGVDAGGVTREWFSVLSRQMFNPDYALFNPVASDRTTFHPNPFSYINPEHHLPFFKFIGRIIGKALYEGRVLDCHFSRAVYKEILGQQVTMKDMETLDLDYSKNMTWMLNNNITDILTETFSISQDKFGVEEIIDLVPNGRNIAVTEENKGDFVRKVIDYRLTGSVREQLDHFLGGFYDIVSPELISIFDEGELELLISGMPDIDVDDWKANTDYQNYNASSAQIQWFWRAVRSFDQEERAKLLQFVTGTGKVPLNGFKELEGMNGFTRFSVHKDFSSKERLPSSHTCFNQLDLPEYDNYESLRRNLHIAMTTGNEYFGYA